MTFQVLRRRHLACLSTSDGAGAGSSPSLRPIDDILQSLTGAVDSFDRLVAGKSHEALTQPDNDGGWGVVDIVSHLRDWQLVTGERVQRLLHEDTPELEAHDDSLWAVEHHYRDNDPHQVLDDLRTLREALVEELAPLAPEAWERTATLDRHGTITLHWLMNKVCDHDAKHLQQARDVLA